MKLWHKGQDLQDLQLQVGSFVINWTKSVQTKILTGELQYTRVFTGQSAFGRKSYVIFPVAAINNIITSI